MISRKIMLAYIELEEKDLNMKLIWEVGLIY